MSEQAKCPRCEAAFKVMHLDRKRFWCGTETYDGQPNYPIDQSTECRIGELKLRLATVEAMIDMHIRCCTADPDGRIEPSRRQAILDSIVDRMERGIDAEAENAELRADKERLDWIQQEYITVDTFDRPTGQGDADVGWVISSLRCQCRQAH